MSKLVEVYDELIKQFQEENRNGRGEVNYVGMITNYPFVKTEKEEAILSWYYTWEDGNDSITIHYRCFDRCRVNMIQPDGNTLKIWLKAGEERQDMTFSWLDES